MPAPSNSPAPSATEIPLVTLSPGSFKSIKSPCCNLCFKPKEINAFKYHDSTMVSSNEVNDPAYESFESFGKNYAIGWLLLIYLYKLKMIKMSFHNKINVNESQKRTK